MGATGLHRQPGIKTEEFFKQELSQEYRDTVRATHTVQDAFFAVLEVPAAQHPYLVPDENGMVRTCVIILTSRSRNPREYINFSYRIESEQVGPYELRCPDRLLDMLSPVAPDQQDRMKGTLAWRQSCRERNAFFRAIQQPGNEIVSSEPIPCGSLGAEDRFVTVGRVGRDFHFTRAADKHVIRIHESWFRTMKVAA